MIPEYKLQLCTIKHSIDMYATQMTIKPSYSTIYSAWQGEYSLDRSYNIKSLKNLENNNQKGVLSKKSKSQLIDKIDWLMSISKTKSAYNQKFKSTYKFKLALITLTLSSQQIHSDQDIKRELLNSFLVELKRCWNVLNFVWRAEAQKNGNIHFHVVVDKFIPALELRDKWNIVQEKLGYITRYSKGDNPNSTDIHSLRKVHNLRAYLSKYMSKSGGGERLINGRIWSCSRQLSMLKGCQIVLSSENYTELKQYWRLNKKRFDLRERCTIVKSNIVEMCKSMSFVSREVKLYLSSIFDVGNIAKKTTKIIEIWSQSTKQLNPKLLQPCQLSLPL